MLLAAAFAILAQAAWASTSDATTHSVPVRLEYAYYGPMAATGSIQGHCVAWGVRFDEGLAGQVGIWSDGRSRLTIRETYVNESLVDGVPAQKVATQTQDSRVLEPGPLLVRWDPTARVAIIPYEAQVPHQGHPAFGAQFEANHLQVSPKSLLVPGPAPYWMRTGALLREEPGHFSLGLRRVETDGPLRLSGNVTWFLAGASIQAADGSWTELGPHREVQTLGSTNGVELRSTRIVDAFLDLPQPRLELSPSGLELLCGGLELRISGAASVGGARGVASAFNQTQAFEDQVLSLRGVFRVEEPHIVYPPKHARGHAWVEATAEGDVETLGLDFQPFLTTAAAPAWHVVEAIGIVGLLALLLLGLLKGSGHVVGLLYSRLAPEQVLNHPNRQRIYDAVQASPGADLSQLATTLSLPLTSLTYHVRILQRNGKVGTIRHGKSVRVLPKEFMPARSGHLPPVLLPLDAQLSFVHELLQSGPQNLTHVVDEVQVRFQLSRRGALHAVHRGVERGLFAKQPSPNGRGGKAQVIRCA